LGADVQRVERRAAAHEQTVALGPAEEDVGYNLGDSDPAVTELLEPRLLVRRSCGFKPDTTLEFGDFESVSL